MYVFNSAMTIIVWKYFKLIYYYMNLSKLLNNFTNGFLTHIYIIYIDTYDLNGVNYDNYRIYQDFI